MPKSKAVALKPALKKPVRKKPARKRVARQPSSSASLKTARALALASSSTDAPALREVLAALKAKASKRTLAGMARFAIPATHAWGVSVADIRAIAKRFGRDHALAAALWKSGVYEARMLSAFVDEPERVTRAQMDRWCRDFDSWALCDTLCFHLYDRTPHAFDCVESWAANDREFVKRAAFALLASLAAHDKSTPDAAFVACLPLVETAATDERNFVKKGVSWALRMVGRRSRALNIAALAVAGRLQASPARPAQWVGRDAARELRSSAVNARLERRSAR